MQGLISELVKGRFPQQPPLQQTSTLERGCQLLLDYNENMTPFWEDLTALAGQLEKLLGKARMNVYEFEDHPNTAEAWVTLDNSNKWQIELGRPILVASNLGINGQLRRFTISRQWRGFINTCQKHKLPLLILVPWGKEYWPSGLGCHPLLIPWQPSTSAAMVQRLTGKGHQVL